MRSRNYNLVIKQEKYASMLVLAYVENLANTSFRNGAQCPVYWQADPVLMRIGVNLIPDTMTKQEIKDIESVAGFMGYPVDMTNVADIIGVADAYITDNQLRDVAGEELLFSSSWDWLMPVVEKIESEHSVTFNIEGDNVHINGDFKLSVFEHSKKESVYKAIVKFVKWYNKQQA